MIALYLSFLDDDSEKRLARGKKCYCVCWMKKWVNMAISKETLKMAMREVVSEEFAHVKMEQLEHLILQVK